MFWRTILSCCSSQKETCDGKTGWHGNDGMAVGRIRTETGMGFAVLDTFLSATNEVGKVGSFLFSTQRKKEGKQASMVDRASERSPSSEGGSINWWRHRPRAPADFPRLDEGFQASQKWTRRKCPFGTSRANVSTVNFWNFSLILHVKFPGKSTFFLVSQFS